MIARRLKFVAYDELVAEVLLSLFILLQWRLYFGCFKYSNSFRDMFRFHLDTGLTWTGGRRAVVP